MVTRVAFLTCVYPPYPGGMGMAAKGMAEEALRHGYEVEVFAPHLVTNMPRPYHGNERVKINNFRLVHANEKGAGEKMAADAQLRGVVKTTELVPLVRYGNSAILPQLIWRMRSFDIIHLFYPFFGAAELLPIIRRTTKAKIIVHHIMDAVAEGWLGKFFSWHRRYLLPTILRHSDLVLDMSEDFFRGSDFGATRKLWAEVPMDFLPLGVDTNLFQPAEKKNHDVQAIIFVGGLDRAHYFKGIPVLLRSLEILRKKGLKFRCLIVGGGDMKKDYETLAGKLGLLEGAVIFGGLVPNEKLPDYYCSADIFVMPSTARVESFCIASAEAQACGLPAIVSDFPGVRVTIEDRVTGFRVRPGDIKDLTENLATLLQDTKLREDMGVRGRERMVQKYDWEVVGRKLDEIYRKLIPYES